MAGIANGGQSDQDGGDAGEQNIGAVGVGGETELATQAAEPQDGLPGPGFVDEVYEQGGEQDQEKKAAHAFEAVDAHVFDIEALFLIEAVGVFDAWPAAPLGVDLFGVLAVGDGDVGQQNDLPMQVQVIGDQRPDALLGLEQPQGELAQADGGAPGFAGMLEGDGQAQGPGHRSGQFMQVFGAFPAL